MIKTLLVDGENLFRIGFHAVTYYHNEKHVGGIFHFMNTLRKFIQEHDFDKVVVFWDGEDNDKFRKEIYPQYKQNRKKVTDTSDIESFQYQKIRIQQYLEETYIRQIDIEFNEADDLISYYCRISKDEIKTIFSADRDLLQLISDNVSVYSPTIKTLLKDGDRILIDKHWIPHFNLKTYKILLGDKSDNINGIKTLGVKKLLSFFPEILEQEVSFDYILYRAKKLFKENKNNTLRNIVNGITKDGERGEEFYRTNQQLIDLSIPIITDEGRVAVEQVYSETLDPEGRNYKNLIRMMNEDGFFKFLPKHNHDWVDFIRPFLKITRKEKRNFNN